MRLGAADAILSRGRARDRAIVEAGGAVTYGELRQRVRELARVMVDAGLAPGDRIALCGENSAQTIAAYFAVMAAGGVVVPVAPGLAEARLARLLERGRCRFAITSEASEGAIRAAGAANLESVWIGPALSRARISRGARPSWPSEVKAEELAAIMWTS